MKDFELVQVHLSNDGKEAQVTIRNKNSYLAYSGTMSKLDIPQTVYPPDYFKK